MNWHLRSKKALRRALDDAPEAARESVRDLVDALQVELDEWAAEHEARWGDVVEEIERMKNTRPAAAN